jgi:hypothetical protein
VPLIRDVFSTGRASGTLFQRADRRGDRTTTAEWKMRAEKALVILLRVAAGVLLLALVPVFFPHAWMAAINRVLGLGELPETAIIGYLTRSLSAMYAFHGALVLCVSLDVRRYRPFIICLAALGMVFGVFMLALDVVLGMPWSWTACEGPFILVLSTAILALAFRVKDGRVGA